MENHQAGNSTSGKLPADSTQDKQVQLRLGLAYPAWLTGCSFNPRLTRCVKNNGQQKQQPATSSSQSGSDTLTSYPLWVFALKNPALRTIKQVLTSLD